MKFILYVIFPYLFFPQQQHRLILSFFCHSFIEITLFKKQCLAFLWLGSLTVSHCQGITFAHRTAWCLWIHFLMFPFPNRLRGLSGGDTVRMRAKTEKVREEEDWCPASLHLVGWLRASKKPPQSTKPALFKISAGHQEGLTALFS